MSKTTALIIAALCVHLNTSAQQDTTHLSELVPVIVTANKSPQKQSTTGKITTIITKETIERNAGRSLGQLLSEQAGITINGAYNNPGTGQSLFIRGASNGRTLVLLDGIPIYDPSMLSNEFDMNLLSLNNIEQIEICRGAQSTNYGSDAVAGVINIITFKPTISKPFDLRATAAAGNYGLLKGGINISGANQRFSYSLKYAQLHSNGFSTAYDSSLKAGYERDGFTSRVFSGQVKYQLTSSLALQAYIHRSSNRTDIDAAAFNDEKDYLYTNRSVNTGAGILYNKNKLYLRANYQYTRGKRDYLNDSTDVPGSTIYSTLNYLSKSHYAEIYSKITFSEHLSLLQGADFRSSGMNSRYFSFSTSGPYLDTFNDTVLSQASLYASLLYQGNNKRLNIDLGGRLNVHSQYGSNSTFTFNPSWSINDHFRLTGSVASAFKAPTLYQLYSAYGEATLQPEKSLTYELGMEQNNTLIRSRLVLFYRNIREGIDFNYLTYKYYNLTKQSVKGIEIESLFKPFKQIAVTLNYTYLHPVESSQSRTTFKDTVYNYLLRRPAHTINAQVNYEVTDHLNISAGAKYVSKRFDIGGYQQADIALDDYILINAYLSYKIGKSITLFADGQNITNNTFTEIRGYNSIPFMFSTGVSYQL